MDGGGDSSAQRAGVAARPAPHAAATFTVPPHKGLSSVRNELCKRRMVVCV